MIRKNLTINGIPALLWGEPSNKLFIAVHGNLSRKDDDVIAILAEEAAAKGCRVLSFDLPEHGDRKGEGIPCMVQNCVADLAAVLEHARTLSSDLSLFACSMGAYFSLLAFRDQQLRQGLFLSPLVNMGRLIDDMMKWFNVSEERLRTEKEIPTPAGQTLYWDYYRYVKDHPVDQWDTPTAILYGSADTVSASDEVTAFVRRHQCRLQVLEGGEHYFHTDEQLRCFRQWLKDTIVPQEGS